MFVCLWACIYATYICNFINFFLNQQLILMSLCGVSKESACDAGDLGSIPGLGRSPGEGYDHSLQYFVLENSMDYIVHGVTKSMESDMTERPTR